MFRNLFKGTTKSAKRNKNYLKNKIYFLEDTLSNFIRILLK